MLCGNCGEELKDRWKICPYCGASVDNAGREQRVAKREKLAYFSFGKYLLFSILTLGIYSIVTLYRFNETVNKLCAGDRRETPNYIVVILLGLVTLGIYPYCWMYKQATRLQMIAPRYGYRMKEQSTGILLWATFGMLLLAGPFIAWYKMFNCINPLIRNYNRGKIKQDYVPSSYKKDRKPLWIIGGFYLLWIILYSIILGLIIKFLLTDTVEGSSQTVNTVQSLEAYANWKEEGFPGTARADFKVTYPLNNRDANNFAVLMGPLSTDIGIIMQEDEEPVKNWQWIGEDTQGEISYTGDFEYLGVSNDENAYPVFLISSVEKVDQTGENASPQISETASEASESTVGYDSGKPETASANGTDGTTNSLEYILPDSSSRVIDPSEFGDFSINDMQMAINEIYARHGRRFGNEGIQAYFDSKSWYAGTIEPDAFDESVLSDVEKENIDTLSYWMQPELTRSNPTVIDKYDYGVDATAEEEQEDTSSGIYGTYADGNGNTIQITESYGTNPRGIDYIGIVEGFGPQGLDFTLHMTEFQGDYYQLVPGGTKVVALIYPGDGGISVEYRYASEKNGWYEKQ